MMVLLSVLFPPQHRRHPSRNSVLTFAPTCNCAVSYTVRHTARRLAPGRGLGYGGTFFLYKTLRTKNGDALHNADASHHCATHHADGALISVPSRLHRVDPNLNMYADVRCIPMTLCIEGDCYLESGVTSLAGPLDDGRVRFAGICHSPEPPPSPPPSPPSPDTCPGVDLEAFCRTCDKGDVKGVCVGADPDYCCVRIAFCSLRPEGTDGCALSPPLSPLP